MKSKRDRGRDTEGHTERQRDAYTERQSDIHVETEGYANTEMYKYRNEGRYRAVCIYRQPRLTTKERNTCAQRDRVNHRERERKTSMQIGR